MTHIKDRILFYKKGEGTGEKERGRGGEERGQEETGGEERGWEENGRGGEVGQLRSFKPLLSSFDLKLAKSLRKRFPATIIEPSFF